MIYLPHDRDGGPRGTEALEGDGEGERWERASSSLPLLARGEWCVCLSVKEAVFKAPFHSLLAAT